MILHAIYITGSNGFLENKSVISMWLSYIAVSDLRLLSEGRLRKQAEKEKSQTALERNILVQWVIAEKYGF